VWHSNFLENSGTAQNSKNRSPSVWRKEFVPIFDGPTISRASLKLSDRVETEHSWTINAERLNGGV